VHTPSYDIWIYYRADFEDFFYLNLYILGPRCCYRAYSLLLHGVGRREGTHEPRCYRGCYRIHYEADFQDFFIYIFFLTRAELLLSRVIFQHWPECEEGTRESRCYHGCRADFQYFIFNFFLTGPSCSCHVYSPLHGVGRREGMIESWSCRGCCRILGGMAICSIAILRGGCTHPRLI